MRKLLTIPILLFTLMFSSTSYADWKEVGDGGGKTSYVDFDRIRKNDGYVYFWNLIDYLKQDEFGELSVKVYFQGDCKLFRFKYLSGSGYKEPMGKGTSKTYTSLPDKWVYPPPNTPGEVILKSVCDWVK